MAELLYTVISIAIIVCYIYLIVDTVVDRLQNRVAPGEFCFRILAYTFTATVTAYVLFVFPI